MDGQKITAELLAQAERLERDWSSMAKLLRGAAAEITQCERRIAEHSLIEPMAADHLEEPQFKAGWNAACRAMGKE